MLKGAGIVCIILAAVFAARELCLEYRYHIRIWRDFYDSLLLIRSEILYLQTPLPYVLHELAENGPGLLRGMYAAMEEDMLCYKTKGFSKIWTEALRKEPCIMRLGEEEKQAMASAGEYLGHADAQVAKERLAFCLEETQERISELEKKIGEKKKITCALAALAGSFVILVFL